MKTSFRQYLVENESTIVYTLEEAADYISKHCMDAFNGSPVYRGVGARMEAQLCNPMAYERRSSGLTENFFTLVQSRSDKWKDYPRRNHALIGSIVRGDADSYGNLYRVFSEDNARWGICPNGDFWFAFSNTIKFATDLSLLNSKLAMYFKKLHDLSIVESYPHPNFSTNYQVMIDTFETVDEALKTLGLTTVKNILEDGIDDSMLGLEYMRMSEEFFNAGSVLEVIDNILDPVSNGFEYCIGADGLPRNGGRNAGEVWTNAKCVIVQDKDYDKLIELVAELTA